MKYPAILGLATALPPYRHDQVAIGAWMKAAYADQPALARWLGLIYAGGGIAHRHSVLPDLLAPERQNRWSPVRAPEASPGTGERMRLYRRYAPELALAATRPLVAQLDASGALGREAITHLVVISCTGFYAPGLDLDLALGLDLRRDLKRSFVGFMGCAAGITGLRLAAEIVQGDPEALVLVVAAELCTLHLQPSGDREALLSASLFGDGAGAALVGRPREQMDGLFALDSFATHVTPDTESEMVWTIGDHGFALRLSPQVPERVAAAAPALIAELAGGRPSGGHPPAGLNSQGPRRMPPVFWALHPGGKGILDRLERACDLEPEALEPSRWVLRERGNLSSATIFHVLERWAERLAEHAPCDGVAVAFGPGLVTELAALRWLGARTEVGALRARRAVLR